MNVNLPYPECGLPDGAATTAKHQKGQLANQLSSMTQRLLAQLLDYLTTAGPSSQVSLEVTAPPVYEDIWLRVMVRFEHLPTDKQIPWHQVLRASEALLRGRTNKLLGNNHHVYFEDDLPFISASKGDNAASIELTITGRSSRTGD